MAINEKPIGTASSGLSSYLHVTAGTTTITELLAVDIDRGGKRKPSGGAKVDVGVASITTSADLDLSYTSEIRPGSQLLVRHFGGGNVVKFTGWISDIDQRHELDRTSGKIRTVTTITAVDAVSEAQRQIIYGRTTSAGFETWQNRMRNLQSRTNLTLSGQENVPLHAIPGARYAVSNDPASPTGWTWGYIASASNGMVYWRRTASGSASPAANSMRWFWSLEGLSVGSTYTLTVPVTAEITGTVTNGNLWNLSVGSYSLNFNTPTGGAVVRATIEFVATASTMTATVQNRAGQTWAQNAQVRLRLAQVPGYRGPGLMRVGDETDIVLADTVFESSLANHLDLACDSTGSRWFADANGHLSVLYGDATPVYAPPVTFTDNPETPDALHYVNAVTNLDTRGTVNTLNVTNHRQKPDPDIPGGWLADDVSLTHLDARSVGRYGVRAEDVDWNIWTGGAHSQDIQARAAAIFNDSDRPTLQVTRLVWNAQEDLTADNFEIGQVLTVEYAGRRQTCRIAGLSHRITPTRWMITIDLADIRVGSTWNDVNASTQLGGSETVNLATRPVPTTSTSWGGSSTGTTKVLDTTIVRRPGRASIRIDRGTASPSNFVGSLFHASPVIPGAYTFSAHLRANFAGARASITPLFYNGTTLLNPSNAVTFIPIPSANTWHRLSCTFTAPAGTTSVEWNVQICKAGGQTTNGTEKVWLADAMLTTGTVLTDYGDGYESGWTWDGTAGASTSHQLPATTFGALNARLGTKTFKQWNEDLGL